MDLNTLLTSLVVDPNHDKDSKLVTLDGFIGMLEAKNAGRLMSKDQAAEHFNILEQIQKTKDIISQQP